MRLREITISQRGAAAREARPPRRTLARGTVLLIATLVTVPFVASEVDPTVSIWADEEYGSSDLLTAYTVPPPAFAGTCILTPGFLGTNPVITVNWTVPAGYTVANAEFAVSGVSGLEVVTGALLAFISTTGNETTGYTTHFGSGLLGGLLGGTKTVGIRLVLSGTSPAWTSFWSTATGTMGTLGSNPTCTVNPPAP